ncbi:unnamed protein product [Rangifer tarandus platyrhynchus]|uniref:Uncharacterized protein n=1 Tax=Rangifer tarandus platyrhynchus TaxID=3082113 RepID=A0AC59ZHU2_RANTA
MSAHAQCAEDHTSGRWARVTEESSEKVSARPERISQRGVFRPRKQQKIMSQGLNCRVCRAEKRRAWLKFGEPGIRGAKTLASAQEDNEQCVDSVLRSVGTTEA